MMHTSTHCCHHTAQARDGGSVRVTCSMLEIYNEQVFDLLNRSAKNLKVCEKGLRQTLCTVTLPL